MKRFLVLALSFAAFACSNNASKPTPASGPVYHTVSLSGETLGAISDWYTGSPNNWRLIAKENGSLNPDRLRLGDQIYIPATLVFRREPFPASMIASSKKPVKSTPANSAAQPPQPAETVAVVDTESVAVVTAEKVAPSGQTETVTEVAVGETQAVEVVAPTIQPSVAPAAVEEKVSGAVTETTAAAVKSNEASDDTAALANAGYNEAEIARAKKAQEEAQRKADAALEAGKAAAEKAAAESQAALKQAGQQVSDAQAASAVQDAAKSADVAAQAVAEIPTQAEPAH
ncbi:MAG: hypothetical protein J0M12_14300 [Deltaproteobacteria bacterium]|nr:hypothetical protein [Deltaproteobacteria bacterium]